MLEMIQKCLMPVGSILSGLWDNLRLLAVMAHWGASEEIQKKTMVDRVGCRMWATGKSDLLNEDSMRCHYGLNADEIWRCS
jgi:hypothetical protein